MILDMHVHTVASDDSMATDDISLTGGAEFSITNFMRDLRRTEMLDWLIIGGDIQGTHDVQPNRPGLVGLQGG